MIDVLVETTEAFLEHLSINRITMGNLVSFIEKIGLEDTKTKLAKTLKAIQVSNIVLKYCSESFKLL